MFLETLRPDFLEGPVNARSIFKNLPIISHLNPSLKFHPQLIKKALKGPFMVRDNPIKGALLFIYFFIHSGDLSVKMLRGGGGGGEGEEEERERRGRGIE